MSYAQNSYILRELGLRIIMTKSLLPINLSDLLMPNVSLVSVLTVVLILQLP